MTNSTNASSTTPAQEGRLQGIQLGVTLAVAVVAIIAFGVLIAFLSVEASSSSEQVWQRRVYLFGGVEAIVFAAVGWLFGREVNRRQAEQSEKRADESERTARDNVRRATDLEARGQALKAAIQSRNVSYSDPALVRSRGIGDEAVGAVTSDMRELADFADRVFPE